MEEEGDGGDFPGGDSGIYDVPYTEEGFQCFQHNRLSCDSDAIDVIDVYHFEENYTTMDGAVGDSGGRHRPP